MIAGDRVLVVRDLVIKQRTREALSTCIEAGPADGGTTLQLYVLDPEHPSEGAVPDIYARGERIAVTVEREPRGFRISQDMEPGMIDPPSTAKALSAAERRSVLTTMRNTLADLVDAGRGATDAQIQELFIAVEAYE